MQANTNVTPMLTSVAVYTNIVLSRELIQNILHFVGGFVVVHLSAIFHEADPSSFFDHPRVLVNDTRLPTKWGHPTIFHAHMLNIEFFDKKVGLHNIEFIQLCANNQLFFKRGLYNYIKGLNKSAIIRGPFNIETRPNFEYLNSIVKRSAHWNNRPKHGYWKSWHEGMVFTPNIYSQFMKSYVFRVNDSVQVAEEFILQTYIMNNYPHDEVDTKGLVYYCYRQLNNNIKMPTTVSEVETTSVFYAHQILHLLMEIPYIFSTKIVPLEYNDPMRVIVRNMQQSYIK